MPGEIGVSAYLALRSSFGHHFKVTRKLGN